MNGVPRSWLYVPGHRADRVAKALVAGADAVVVDLEDAVPADRKDTARQQTVDLLAQRSAPGEGPVVWVRINPAGSEAGSRDVVALAGARADGLRLPRAEDPDAVREVADRTGLPLQLLLENARGLLRAHELATSHDLVTGIGLGEADLSADLLVDHEDGLAWARGWVVVAARAAGLPAPVQSVWTDVGDPDGLRASCVSGRRGGCYGRSVIHPRQLDVVHEVYTPSAAEVDRAAALVEVAAAAAARGESAALGPDGRFVDPAVVARARIVLDRARPGTTHPIPVASPPTSPGELP